MKAIKRFFIIICITLLILVIAVTGMFLFYKNRSPFIPITNNLNIERIYSDIDFDNDGIDDYSDILEGAKIEAKNKPTYRSAYYAGGYPPDDEGVCTDVIWRAFKNAGYLLKDMVDEDIKNNVDKYPRVQGKPDPNIDFRRVLNLKVYFERNQLVLTNDLSKIEEWQPGDIVAFSDMHVGIISDKRNKRGVPYLIHNANQFYREEDTLELWNLYKPITGHYRLKSSKDYDNTNEQNMNFKVNVIVNETKFPATLKVNETTKELMELLPLEMNMKDLNKNEKYFYLSEQLPTNFYNPQSISAGDIMLYDDNCLVIFYDNFNTNYSYTRLGKVDNMSYLKEIFNRTNNVTVILEKAN